MCRTARCVAGLAVGMSVTSGDFGSALDASVLARNGIRGIIRGIGLLRPLAHWAGTSAEGTEDSREMHVLVGGGKTAGVSHTSLFTWRKLTRIARSIKEEGGE